MPFQPVASTCEVELVFLLDNQIIENTLYFRNLTGWEPGDLLAVADACVEWWAADMADWLTNRIVLQRVIATNLADQTGPSVLTTGFLPAAGSINSDCVPSNCALCIGFRTALIGRSFRGRNYVAGIAEGNVTLNTVETLTANGIRGAYENLPSHLPTDVQHVVVSRTVNKVVQTPSALTNQVTAYTLTDNVLDSQRRRLPGRGR